MTQAILLGSLASLLSGARYVGECLHDRVVERRANLPNLRIVATRMHAVRQEDDEEFLFGIDP